ncbi:P-loop containing nucleoside triphosphate hydrolase protein [Mycena sp. CBHHK59/15]|nr:P-loop containing nucleoside triphosphate hydrolase protein [Mycena sp. CBHHK59/15]
MVAASKPVAPKSLPSKVRIYKPNEIDLASLSEKAQYQLGRTPHEFQTRFFSNVMQGKDIILDIGTGSGKSLCFDLPVLMNKEDIVLVVSPLTALMLEQAAASPLESIAICQETMAMEGRDALYKRAAKGTAQRIFVSPEVAGSLEFSKMVLGQARFQQHLRLVVIDEAIVFRSEYAELGVLRGRVPSSTVFAIASATLPTHVLDDVCAKLKINKEAVTVSMSNARPNVALSVRKIMHPDETKADLRILIPEGATTAGEIPISLVYFNQRIDTEDACDRLQSWASNVGIDESAIAFYHAKVGTARKRELECMLKEGTVRILCCTDAVGMGCDMRNIQRVILWKLPPSFCALAQRSGRAVRDFEALGEAILFVPAKVLKDGIAEEQARLAREEAAAPQNQEGEDFIPEVDDGLDVVAGQAVAVGEGGVRVEQNAEAEEEDPEVTAAAQKKKKKRKAARVSHADALEARFLSRFACTTACRRIVWDDYFQNGKKPPLVRAVPAGARCCDNCEPTKFIIELVEVEKIPGLKGGKKRKWPTELSDAIRTGLRKWSRVVLMPLLYPAAAGFSMTGSALLPDATIEQLAMCGERVDTVDKLRRRARWFLMSVHGTILLQALQQIFDEYDLSDAAQEPDEPDDAQDIFDMIIDGRGGGRARARGGTAARATRARGGTAAQATRARGGTVAQATRARGVRGRGRPKGSRSRGRG